MNFKFVLSVVSILLAGCSSTVKNQTILTAEKFCSSRGGLDEIKASSFAWHDSQYWDTVVCKDKEKAYIGKIADENNIDL